MGADLDRHGSRVNARPARFDRTAQHRRVLLAKVHIARKDLGLDEDTYRGVLSQVTGKTSAGTMCEAELEKVLAHMAARGFTTKRRATGRPAGADHPAARKARALWLSLHELGVVHNASEHALEAFACRQLGCERLQWARQSDCFRLIEALKAMAERHGWPQRGPNGEALSTDELKAGLRAAIARRASQ